jgi:hypothetical protein
MSFYVTIRDGGRVGWLAGPFNRHGDALRFVEPARRLAHELNREQATWAGFGTARRKADRNRVGILNDRLGLTPADLHGWDDTIKEPIPA